MARRRIPVTAHRVPPRSSIGVGARQPASGPDHPTQPFAGRRSYASLRARSADVADPGSVRTTTLPPKAPVAPVGVGSPPNPRLLLTGAVARRSRAPAAEAQGVRWKPDLFILHNRAGGGTTPSAKFPATGHARCLGSRRQRPARDTVRAAAKLRATGIWAPRGRRGPAVRGVYFSWPPAAGAPGGAPGGHPNRGAPLAARAVPHGARSAGGSGRGSPQGGDGASVGRARPRHGSMGGPPRGWRGPAAQGSPPPPLAAARG